MTGYKDFSDDVQVITLDSLHLLDPKEVGILIVDEVHVAASDTRAENLLNMRLAARWGVSATPSGRFDGRDLVTEGVFGPVVHQSTYGDAVRAGALVPITVYWIECPTPNMGIENYLKYTSRAGRYRNAVYKNIGRNQLIGEILRRLPDDMQALVIMQFLEQMEYIKQQCDTNVEIVHAETSAEKLADYQNLRAISAKERKEIYTRMENSDIKRILSTHVYSTGVNFPSLEVVINAGGGGSEIVSKQIPGRESRKTADKQRSYLIDFWHPWDQTMNTETKRMRDGPVHADDRAREKVYTQLEFEQVWIKNINEIPLLAKTT
jgi:superfamily II DNA or RNA helicase